MTELLLSHQQNPDYQRKLEALKRRKPETLSVLERFILLPHEEKLERFAQLDDHLQNRLLTDIRYKGRPDQQLPKELLDPSLEVPYIWLMNWGRGTGQTEAAGGNLHWLAETNPGLRPFIIGTTAAE